MAKRGVRDLRTPEKRNEKQQRTSAWSESTLVFQKERQATLHEYEYARHAKTVLDESVMRRGHQIEAIKNRPPQNAPHHLAPYDSEATRPVFWSVSHGGQKSGQLQHTAEDNRSAATQNRTLHRSLLVPSTLVEEDRVDLLAN
ncbi:hypothetical protein T265_03380 [Opisthorchis viverrini]|uniref:Uncharacterized protein n=1 Tax=Opisthorchis viverrini TaxID=6198 RepID=A0A075AHL9_OPIVI|nr:hypothetical protein T265_03380 [Opisthorchis viverrini]KER30114.1 hypothetical protein T265_03380 [Opisthorchis viverrini]